MIIGCVVPAGCAPFGFGPLGVGVSGAFAGEPGTLDGGGPDVGVGDAPFDVDSEASDSGDGAPATDAGDASRDASSGGG